MVASKQKKQKAKTNKSMKCLPSSSYCLLMFTTGELIVNNLDKNIFI